MSGYTDNAIGLTGSWMRIRPSSRSPSPTSAILPPGSRRRSGPGKGKRNVDLPGSTAAPSIGRRTRPHPGEQDLHPQRRAPHRLPVLALPSSASGYRAPPRGRAISGRRSGGTGQGPGSSPRPCGPGRAQDASGEGDRAFRRNLVEEGELRPPYPPVVLLLDRNEIGPPKQGGRGEPGSRSSWLDSPSLSRASQYAVAVDAEGAEPEVPRCWNRSGRRRRGGSSPAPRPPRRGRSAPSDGCRRSAPWNRSGPRFPRKAGVPGNLRGDGIRIAPGSPR